LHIVVEQKGINVVVALFAPDGSAGPEPISIIAEAAGSYKLEVSSLEAKAEAGHYQVKIAELRSATGQDRSRMRLESQQD
jgi:hypothetical protein